MRFIKHWKAVLTSLTIVAVFFLIWDAIFTKLNIWGFNPDYHLPFLILGMPIEEWLFFFCIPYASVFIHYSLAYFKPTFLLPRKFTEIITIGLVLLLFYVVVTNYTRAYTVVNFLVLIGVLVYSYYYKGIRYLRRFYLSFFLIFIPFFIVNSILTGTFIEKPIVWYNDYHNLGIRLGTIPIEDIGYAFSMLFANVLLIEFFKEEEGFSVV